MKKFTTIAAALLLGSFGFCASAATVSQQPIVDPAEGTYANFSYEPITLTWEGYTVALTEDTTSEITIKLNDQVVEPMDGMEWSWYFVDEEGEITTETPAAGIKIILPYGYGDSWTYEVEIPEGMFTLTSSSETGTNCEITLEYTGFDFQASDYFIADPTKASKLPSLKTFTVKWDEVDATLNENLANPITYGTMFGGTIGNASIEANNDGGYTVTLDNEYASNGYVVVTFPEGLFTIETDYGDILSPELEITYEIALYSIVPNNYGYVYEDFDSFTIYSENISLVGELSDIKEYDTMNFDENGENVLYTTASSYEEIEDENGEGIKVTFEKSYDVRGSVQIIIPSGTFSFNGTPYEEEIQIFVTVELPIVLPEPTINPADGSTIEQLVSVEISWNESGLEESYLWEEMGSEPFTLTFTPEGSEVSNDPMDITENVSIENEVDDSGYYPMILSGKMVIKFDEPYTDKGKYVINIPAYYVSLIDYEYEFNEALEITLYVGETSGVANLIDGIDSKVEGVYNLQGVKMGNDLNSLAPGLYIINGKKVLIKK